MTLLKTLIQNKGAVGPFAMMGKMAIGGAPSRMALGASVGAVSGYLGTDMEDPTNRLSAAIRGAGLGAAAGGLSRLVTPAMTRSGFKGPGLGGRNMLTGAIGVGKMGAAAVGFTAQYPFLVGGGIAGAAFLNSQSSPYSGTGSAFDMTSSMRLSQEAQALEMMDQGIAPMRTTSTASMARLHGSTDGLVQSLHRRRH